MQTVGIHHITAIVGDPQENVDFYAGVLGLRLVKKTVNFDDPETYHLYFGDDGGRPGTIMTFFPWINAYQGEIGDGQVGVTVFAIPQQSISYWEKRLTALQIAYTKTTRFDEVVLQFSDVHGLQLELVERNVSQKNQWAGGVPAQYAIQGFAGAVLYSADPEETITTLTNTMGLAYVATEGDYTRYVASATLGNTIDVKMVTGERGTTGVGTVHHIAWRAATDAQHIAWQQHVTQQGHYVTDIKDRNYFNALYFREPGRILFEIATDEPGFAHDESIDTMGEGLMLPPQYEEKRQQLEQSLPRVMVTYNEV